MSFLLLVELVILFLLWRFGILRRVIDSTNRRLLLIANGKEGTLRRVTAAMIRAAEYLELTRSVRLSAGGLWVGYAVMNVLLSTMLAGDGEDSLRYGLSFFLLIAILGVVLAVLGGGSLYVHAAQRNMARMLPEALGTMGSEISAGHSVEAAVQRVALQFGKPLNQEFGDALIKMVASGGLITIDQALSEIAQNPLYQSDALDQAALTISVVRPLGGDLGELLTDLSHLLHQREATEREIKAQLAPGRQAAWSLVFIIVGLFIALTLFPLFSNLLYGTYMGRFVLILATIVIGISVFWIIQINSYDV
jgi:tight adherence protein B